MSEQIYVAAIKKDGENIYEIVCAEFGIAVSNTPEGALFDANCFEGRPKDEKREKVILEVSYLADHGILRGLFGTGAR